MQCLDVLEHRCHSVASWLLALVLAPKPLFTGRLVSNRVQRTASFDTVVCQRQTAVQNAKWCCRVWFSKSCTCSVQRCNRLRTPSSSLPCVQLTTLLSDRASRKPARSSFFTSTTECSNESIRTLAPVSSTTSWNACPNLLRP